jgi:hypothetical protein
VIQRARTTRDFKTTWHSGISHSSTVRDSNSCFVATHNLYTARHCC